MPWRGPEVTGEFPTLGYAVAEWIEAHCIVPKRPEALEPFRLTDEQLRFVLRFYRLHPKARDSELAFVYKGAQLMRPQKWGKDPLAAAIHCAEALGPVVFDGWDANGEPVGRAPDFAVWQQCAAVSDDQAENTFRPLVVQFMTPGAPLASWPGVDPGKTRVELSNGGLIEPVTSSAKTRLGAPITFATFTETHLMVGKVPAGGVDMAKNMKRNLTGMNGRWIEVTNAYDVTEHSVAQTTHDSKMASIFVDYRPPMNPDVDLDDEKAALAEIRHVYGDSLRSRGGWVVEERILDDLRDPSVGEAESRRYFLNAIRSGSEAFLDPVRWDAAASADEPLRPGDVVALGFDGSRSRDWTVIVLERLRDRRLFYGGHWEPELVDGDDEPKIDRVGVDAKMSAIFEAYSVKGWHGDPFKWQDYIDAWAARFGKDLILEFPTNSESRMDAAIRRFRTAFRVGELTHDGNELVTQHIRDTVLANGKRRAAHDDDDPTQTHYKKLAKKRRTVFIDFSVAAVLAHQAAGWAIERGALESESSTFIY